jgi:hypothetical protein
MGKLNIIEIFLERQHRINRQSKKSTNWKKEKLQWANLSCDHIILEYMDTYISHVY